MRTNRQKGNQRPSFNHAKPVLQHLNQYFSQKNKPLNFAKNNFVLIDLIQQSNSHELTLICNTKLSIKKHKNNRNHKTNSTICGNFNQKYSQKIYVNVHNRSQNILKQCYENYVQNKKPSQFIFASNYSQNQNKFGTVDKNIGFTNKKHFNSYTINTPKEFINDQNSANQSNKYRSQSNQKNRTKNIFKEIMTKNKKYESEPPNMFVVEQIVGQSIQEDHKDFNDQIKSFNTIKFKPALKQITDKNDTSHNKILNFAKKGQRFTDMIHPQENLSQKQKQLTTKSDINTFENLKTAQNIDINKQNELFDSIQLKKSAEKVKQIVPVQRFSFAKQMKQGIIEHQPFINHKWQSFKLIDDDEIEKQKIKMKNVLEVPLMTDMNEQISSIISSNMKETKKQGEYELDSIKQELQQYENNTCPNINMKKEAQKIQFVQNPKIFESKYFIQDGKEVNDIVQITKRQNDGISNEFHVKYNLRFLDKDVKSNAKVIRISPLKFRRKEQVVKHFMQAHIIQRQSNSINIP